MGRGKVSSTSTGIIRVKLKKTIKAQPLEPTHKRKPKDKSTPRKRDAAYDLNEDWSGQA